jgi:DNA polymerase-3 subunit gamma/tau
MAMQSLYRRYRPRRFSELRGQEHVVRALRNAVINGREGQAYLFSGPRGTGKTSTARILAKVLNCESPVGGEPCCECASCLSVDNGTSYDVLELDAASNNGVDEIRDIIEKASMSSPGRNRVFILDEVHMLSRAAEAALLKTLEEPPPNVVFVLATTDPQKVNETIRSRVQHLSFHLLPMHDLDEYVRWVISDAHLDVSDDAIARVLEQGGGSARDTLSALELVVASGGTIDEPVSIDEFIEGLIERDQARSLSAVAFAMQQGRDARTLGDDIVRTLRDMFLSLMAPELVQLPESRAAIVTDLAKRLGAAAVVRSMETLGTTLIDMRQATEPRLLLEVAAVRLSAPALDVSIDTLTTRIQILEDTVRELKSTGLSSLPPAPIDPSSGRAKVGGRAATGPIPKPTPSQVVDTPQPRPAQSSIAQPFAERGTTAESAPVDVPETAAQKVVDAPSPSQGSPIEVWPKLLQSLKPFVRALFVKTTVASVDGNIVTISAPNSAHLARCEDYKKDVEIAFSKMCGGTFAVALSSDGTASQGIERPDVARSRSIVDEVAQDLDKPIDPAETEAAPATDAIDFIAGKFPGATIIPPDKK